MLYACCVYSCVRATAYSSCRPCSFPRVCYTVAGKDKESDGVIIRQRMCCAYVNASSGSMPAGPAAVTLLQRAHTRVKAACHR